MLHALPFKQEAFDGIICTQVLGDLSEPHESLREFYSVLRKGGIILITESQANELHDEPVDYWRFTRFGLEHLCRSCGLEVIAIRQRGGFFTMLAQQCIRYCIDRFDLYHHSVIGRALNFPLGFMGRLLMMLDHCDKSQANRKHTIGWLVLAKK